MTRKCTPEMANALATAVKLLISDVGGLEAAASCTRVKRSHLAAYGDINSDLMMPADVVVDLEAIGGTPRVSMAMAGMLGYRLEPLGGRPKHDLVSCLQDIAQDNGRLMADVVVLIKEGHGKRCPKKLRAVQRDLAALILAATEAQRALVDGDA